MSQPESFAAARAFARNLNILLKYIRLYGTQHQRTAEQLELTWRELSVAAKKTSGLLIGVAEDMLLIDGAVVDGLGERSFAALLKTAGISSLHFAQNITRAEFDACVYAFAAGKANQAVKQLRDAAPASIKVNEVTFVAQDEHRARATELVAQALGDKAGQMKEWFSDPEKLVQLIAAAEGSRGATSSAPTVPSSSPTDAAPGATAGMRIDEPELQKIFRVLARLGALDNSGTPAMSGAGLVLRDAPDACALLRRAVASLPAVEGEPGDGSIANLAEKLAIRFARQQFERGEVRVDAVHELMERMAKEIDSLRKVLNAHEDKMQRAGMAVESYADVLDRQFWASMPEAGKKSVLVSKDAWCIPPRNVRSYVQELIDRGDQNLAARLLRNYVRQLGNADIEARKRTAEGLSELADLLAKAAPDLLTAALQTIGLRLQCESVFEQQTLLAAAYVRLTQESAQQNDFFALRQSLAILDRLQEWRPRTAAEVRPRISVENRLGQFISDAVAQNEFPNGLVELLRQAPIAAAEHIAVRFSQCERRSERERYIELMRQAGTGLVDCTVGMVRSGNAEEVARNVGLVSRLRPQILVTELTQRLGSFSRPQQDAIVRELGAAGAPDRGAYLAGVLKLLDPLVAPEALDEIGLAPAGVSPGVLLEMASGEGLAARHPYLRVKAIEALGRLRESLAIELLNDLAQSGGGLFLRGRPRELRAAAAQALALIDPDRTAWLLHNGFTMPELRVGALPPSETEWAHARRYPRVQPAKSVTVMAFTDRGRFNVNVSSLNLGGGLIAADRRFPRRGDAVLEWPSGLTRIRSHVTFREVATTDVAFEVVDINLDARGKLRKMLADYLPSDDSKAPISLPLFTGSVRNAERTSAT